MLLACLAVFVVAIAAFTISAVSGGGAGLVLMPVLGLILPPEQVPAALSIGTAVSSVGRMVSFFRSIRWDVVSRFVPMAVPAAWAGVWALSLLPPVYLDLCLGLFLMGNLPLMLRRRPTMGNQSPISPATLPVLGAIAGFISGFTGAVGLLFNGVYYRLGMKKEEIVATRAANDILLHLTKLGLYISYGLLTRQTVFLGGVVALAALLSILVVQRLIVWLHDAVFRQIGHAAACMAGVAMVLMAGHQVIHHDHVHMNYAAHTHEIETDFAWREHRFSIELEPGDLELRHMRVAQSQTGDDAQDAVSVLHLSPQKGVYVTYRHKRPRDLS